MAEPEIKTMKKDIEEMKKKIRTSASIDEPITKIGEPVPSARLAIKQVSEPPNNLPMVPSLPGASLPSEPIFSEKPFEPVESIKQLEQVPTSLGQKPEIERPSRRKTPFKKMVLIVLVVLMLSGAGFYYWKYLRNPEIETPASFISIESTKVISIKEGKETGLLDQLERQSKAFQEKDTFRRILIKKIGPPTGPLRSEASEAGKEKDYFISFQEIFRILGINIPTNILENLKEDHTLFLYAQEESNRLGIIVRLGNIDNLRNNIKSWEGTMPTDLSVLFFGEELTQPANKEFKDNIYRGVNIRYFNFLNPTLSVDYTIIKDYLVIATSKESTYKVIDRILKTD